MTIVVLYIWAYGLAAWLEINILLTLLLTKKKHLSKEALDIIKKCGGFINIRERIKIMKFTKRG